MASEPREIVRTEGGPGHDEETGVVNARNREVGFDPATSRAAITRSKGVSLIAIHLLPTKKLVQASHRYEHTSSRPNRRDGTRLDLRPDVSCAQPEEGGDLSHAKSEPSVKGLPRQVAEK